MARNEKKCRSVAVLVLMMIWALCMQGMSESIYSAEKNTGKSTGKILAMKKDALRRVDALSEVLNTTAKKIWEYAELALEEYRSSQLLGELLQKEGFSVEFGAGGLPTAFVATYGTGKPVIGILGEYDALPGISQKAGITVQDAVNEHGPGHGCGHNLLGVGGAGAALAVKAVMEKYGLTGTVKFFGCPAEETIEGKTYMAREGVFSGLDICLDWHPSDETQVSLDSSQAMNSFEVVFRGKTAHAAWDPWHGRSALDAIELMDIGINFLREHVPTSVRLHFVILDGGNAPNVVPDYARAWYYVRGKDRPEVDEIYARVLKIAQGAALMTETIHEIHFKTGVYNFLKNRTVAELLHRNLQWTKAPVFSDEEKVFSRRLQKELGVKEQGLSETIKPPEEPEAVVSGGSTDVADVSWVVPTASLGVTCFPMEIPGHHWGVVSSTGSTIGFKGMLTAAKVIAASAVEALTNGRVIARAKKEFKEKTKGFVYRSAIPANQKPHVKQKGDTKN